MTEIECFSPDKLRSYLLGDLPEPESLQVLSHLEACSDCEATVTALDRESDTLIESLRKPVVQPEPVSAYRLAAKRAVAYLSESASIAENMKLPKLRDYELLEPLAHGGMGTVYRARHSRLNRQVAVKVLPGRWLKDPAVVARFEREMQAVGSLRHPAIVQATDGGEAEGVHFLVMELVDGLDGAALVQHGGPLPVADACEIVRQAALGMEYVHANGIIHRDLKPSNLMITAVGEVKVLDLGLARIVGEQLADDELTTVGQLMGTLDYMAPEQLENSHQVDERTDIFSLGATLYKLLSGQTPHTTEPREPLLSKLRRIASEPPIPITNRRSDLPLPLCELVSRMLSPKAEDRPPTMQSLAESLAVWTANSDLAKRVKAASKVRGQRSRTELPMNEFSRSESLAIPPTHAVANVANSRRRNRWTGIIATGCMLLALALGVVITLQMTSGQLVIETSTPDVEVRILKAGQPHSQLTLHQTAQSLRLGAGEYDIEIVSNADGLQIENGKFTLKRGETWLAKIVHREGNPIAAVPRADEPTYEGKTLDEWLKPLLQERSPKQLYEGTQALTKLATGERQSEAIAAVLVAIRYHQSDMMYKEVSGQEVSLFRSVIEFLDGRDAKIVIDALASELDRTDEANSKFILNYLISSQEHLRPHVDEKLRRQIEQLTKNASPELRIDALNALLGVAEKDLAKRYLVAALLDTDGSVQLHAAKLLIAAKSNIDEVVATLRRLIQSGELAQRAEVAWYLGDIGAAAEPALPELIAIAKDKDDEISRAAVFATSMGMVSVKDAAIRALAEIGNQTALPVLTDIWLERYAPSRENKRVSEFDRNQKFAPSNNSSDEKWMLDAIEKLCGMRPAFDGSKRQFAWSVDDISLPQAYRAAMSDKGGTTKNFIQIAKQLAPHASDYEILNAIRSVARVDRIPNAEQLQREIEMMDILAQHSDAVAVVDAILERFKSIQSLESISQERTLAITTYFEIATRIWSALEPKLKTSSLVNLLASIGDAKTNVKKFDVTPIREWLGNEEQRTQFQQATKTAYYPTWYLALIGLLRVGLEDDETFPELKARFAKEASEKDNARSPIHLLDRLVTAIEYQPDLSGLFIDLIDDPLLDKKLSVAPGSDGRLMDYSLRAVSLMALQNIFVSANLRERFVPVLRGFAESDKTAEANAAKALLKDWNL